MPPYLTASVMNVLKLRENPTKQIFDLHQIMLYAHSHDLTHYKPNDLRLVKGIMEEKVSNWKTNLYANLNL